MSLTRDDAQQILGVGPNASQSEVKKAYREQAKKHHPDVSDDPQAEETFLEIKKAKNLLLNSRSRSRSHRTSRSSSKQSRTQRTKTGNSQRSASHRSTTGTSRSTHSSTTTGSHQTSESNWRSSTASRTNRTNSTASTTSSSTSGPSSSTASKATQSSQPFWGQIFQTLSQSSLTPSVGTNPLGRLKSIIFSLFAVNYISEGKEILFHPVKQLRRTVGELRSSGKRAPFYILFFRLFFDPFIYQKAAGFDRPRPESAAVHQLSNLLASFHLRAKSVITNGITRTGMLGAIVGAVPIIAVDIFRELTVVGATLSIIGITTAYITFIIYAEENGRLPQQWAAPTDVYPSPIQPWSIWGSIIGLAIVGIIYSVFPTIVLVATVMTFPILLIYSLPLCWVTHPIQKRLLDIAEGLPEWSDRLNLVNIAMSMVLASFLLHTPLTFPLSPIAILDSSTTYEANMWDGILASLFAIPWLVVFAAFLDILDIGWYRNHVEWSHSPVARILWTSAVCSGVGIVLWFVYPPPAIDNLTAAMPTLFLWAGVFLYLYGLVTEA